MIRHVVLFTWQDGTTGEQVQAVHAALTALPPLMRGLEAYSFGSDVGIVEGNADFAVVADFTDEACYLAYREHPAHQEAIKSAIQPIARARTSVQFRA
jgi:Stress responsive A/B Barrel Domain